MNARTQWALSSRPAAATTPAERPPSRDPSRYAASSPSNPAARAIRIQSCGAAPPRSESGAVNSTGSGFHEGAPRIAVESSRCTTSRPQTIQPQGSVVGAEGISSDAAATAPQATAAISVAGLTSWREDGRLRHDLPHGSHDLLDLRLGELREEREGQRAARHVLADRELPLTVAEALAVEAHEVDGGQVGLGVHAALAQAPHRGVPVHGRRHLDHVDEPAPAVAPRVGAEELDALQ